MFVDAGSIDASTELECDVCVVGGGPAGITIARELDRARVRVCLLESGGFTFEAATQALYAGENVGGRYLLGLGDRALTVTRLRFLGGSTNHWAGWCRPLDALDFEPRPGVPDSGWPITRSELDPYYAKAQGLCQLGDYEYEPDYWAQRTGRRPLPSRGALANIMYQFSPPTQFGRTYRADLDRSHRLTAVLHANATALDAKPRGTAVERVRAATLDGRRFTVRARTFVLATGAIENARLLLVSTGTDRRGIGNGHDLVGRYFADHLQGVAGLVALTGKREPAGFYEPHDVRGTIVRGALTTRPGFVRSEGLLRFSGVLERPGFRHLPEDSNVLRVLRSLEDGERGRIHPLFMRSETAPNRESRVTVSHETDALGVPKARVDWRLSELDRRSVERSVEAIGEGLGRQGLGRVFSRPVADKRFWESVTIESHHMGTTRMHRDPSRGVVDGNCGVHGISNLYVAGSSVFPTTGHAHPTLTIVALALRLANRLKQLA